MGWNFIVGMMLIGMSFPGPLLAHGGPVEAIFRYDPAVTTVNGILLARTYPGSPNYESVNTGDKAERIWLLKLPKPINVLGDYGPAMAHETELGYAVMAPLPGPDRPYL